MGQYDIALKHVLQGGGRVFLQSLGVAEPLRRLDTELPSLKERRVDFLAEIDATHLIHIEFQARREESITLRMLGYCSEILERVAGERRPGGGDQAIDVDIRQIVIFLGEGVWTPRPIDHQNLKFRFETFHPLDIEAKPLVEAGDIGDAVLSILCRGGTSPPMIRAILTRIAGAPPTLRSEALAQLFVLSGLRKAGDLVRKEQAIMGITVNVADIPFLRAPIDEAFEKGRIEGEAKVLVRMLRKKFGDAVPDAFLNDLPHQSSEKLEAIADRVLSAERIEDVIGTDVPVRDTI